MTEMLHELVSKRESKARVLESRGFSDMIRQATEAYRQSYNHSSRAERAIDLVMRNRDSISVGSTINMPMLDMSSPANAELITQYMVYTYTGEMIGTYRGWVRTN